MNFNLSATPHLPPHATPQAVNTSLPCSLVQIAAQVQLTNATDNIPTILSMLPGNFTYGEGLENLFSPPLMTTYTPIHLAIFIILAVLTLLTVSE